MRMDQDKEAQNGLIVSSNQSSDNSLWSNVIRIAIFKLFSPSDCDTKIITTISINLMENGVENCDWNKYSCDSYKWWWPIWKDTNESRLFLSYNVIQIESLSYY